MRTIVRFPRSGSGGTLIRGRRRTLGSRAPRAPVTPQHFPRVSPTLATMDHFTGSIKQKHQIHIIARHLLGHDSLRPSPSIPFRCFPFSTKIPFSFPFFSLSLETSVQPNLMPAPPCHSFAKNEPLRRFLEILSPFSLAFPFIFVPR